MLSAGIICQKIKISRNIKIVDRNETKELFGLSSPKKNVFVFNRPTIINLGDNDKEDITDRFEAYVKPHIILGSHKQPMLYGIIKVRRNQIIIWNIRNYIYIID